MKYTAAIFALAATVAAQVEPPVVSDGPIIGSDSPIVNPLPTTGSMMTGGGGSASGMSDSSMMTGSMTESMTSSGSGSMTETPTPTSTLTSVITSGGMTSTLTTALTPSGSDGAAAPTNGAKYMAPVVGIAAAVAML
ncbi:hypothetical protein K4F52_001685 [Lecanicillium sp. MT-2017a]|nr:hypothetical protein K4F52_001685 [Lecanicillium sp. MT-2017a]